MNENNSCKILILSFNHEPLYWAVRSVMKYFIWKFISRKGSDSFTIIFSFVLKKKGQNLETFLERKMEYLQGKKRLPLLKQSFNCSHPHWSPCLSWWKRKQEENRIEESLYCIGKLIPSMTYAFWLSRADLPTLCVSNFYDFCWGILWQAFLMVWIWFLFSDKVKVKVKWFTGSLSKFHWFVVKILHGLWCFPEKYPMGFSKANL